MCVLEGFLAPIGDKNTVQIVTNILSACLEGDSGYLKRKNKFSKGVAEGACLTLGWLCNIFQFHHFNVM